MRDLRQISQVENSRAQASQDAWKESLTEDGLKIWFTTNPNYRPQEQTDKLFSKKKESIPN